MSTKSKMGQNPARWGVATLPKSVSIPPAVGSPLGWELDGTMHFYPFHIGDYQSHTSHLDEIEDLAYRRLLDWCYLHESPLPLEPELVARLVRMRTHTERIAVVLQEFFQRTSKGWVHDRVQREIASTQSKSEKAKASAKARWDKHLDATALQSQSEGNATNTQDPIPNTQEPSLLGTEVPNRPQGCGHRCDHKAVIDLYHKHLPTLNRIEVWNATRQSLLKSRWREVAVELAKDGAVDEARVLDWWKRFFIHVGNSKFLTGRTEKPFKADLEWLVRPTNFAKVIENKYHGG